MSLLRTHFSQMATLNPQSSSFAQDARQIWEDGIQIFFQNSYLLAPTDTISFPSSPDPTRPVIAWNSLAPSSTSQQPSASDMGLAKLGEAMLNAFMGATYTTAQGTGTYTSTVDASFTIWVQQKHGYAPSSANDYLDFVIDFFTALSQCVITFTISTSSGPVPAVVQFNPALFQ